MRLKLIKYGLAYVLVCMIATFLMSHNTYALGAYIPNTAIGRFKTSFSSNFNGDDNCSTSSPAYLNRIRTTFDPLQLSPDSDYIVSMTFFNSANSNSFDGKIPIAWRSYWEGIFTIRDIELENTSPSQFTLYMVIHTASSIAGGAANNIYLDFYSDDYMILYQNECVSNWGWLTRVTWSGDDAIINYTGLLNDIASKLNNIQNNQPTQQQITNLNNSVNNLNSSIDNHFQKEDQAVSNIDNQSTSDIPNSSNGQTTSIIGAIQSFVSALTGLTTGSCWVNLNFPNFAGGTQRVNLCQNKEYSGNIVSIGGSVLLVVFYIPIAFMMLNKIYSEIRSFTNG